MRKFREKMETFFDRGAGLVIRFRFAILLLSVILAVLLAVNIRNLQFDTSNEGFLRAGDPILVTYNDFREQFGRDDMLILAIHSDDIFSLEFLTRLKKLHDTLESEIANINDMISMVNARSTRGEGDVLMVDDLLLDFPDSEEQLQTLKSQVMSNPLYLNQLISADGLYTTIVIESSVYTASGEVDLLSGFDEDTEEIGGNSDNGLSSGKFISDQENSEFVEAVYEVVRNYRSDDFQIYIAGSPAVMHSIKLFMQSDVKKFMRIAILVIGVCLFVMFRRLSGVILPLAVVAVSVASTIGLMALLGVSFKLPTTILPSFLLAVGVGASVHVLSLTYQALRRGTQKNQAIRYAFSHSGLAIVMTSLTTAAGLASFSFAGVAPIADLGIFASIGVLFSLWYTLTMLPALLASIPLKEKDPELAQRRNRVDRLLEFLADYSIDHYRKVLIISAALLVVAIYGAVQVRFSHQVLNWLPEDLGVRVSTEVIDRELKGSVVLEVLLDTGVENGLYDRDTLLAIDRLTEDMERDFAGEQVFVGKSIAVTTILKEIHQALYGNNPDFYKVPDNEKLIPQEFLLFENSGSDDLQDVVDSRFQIARITLKVPWQDALLYRGFINETLERFEAEFSYKSLAGGEPMQVTVTGIMAIFGRIISAAIYSTAQSYIIALVIITLLMIVLIGNLKLGFISMIPNLTPILCIVGFMGLASIQFDMFTMLIAPIAVGLAVDDTIHFMYNFKKYFEQTGDVREAVHQTLQTAGRAMLTTSVVLSIGFFIFTLASMNNLFYFGLLTGIAILLALGADLILAPALMALVVGRTQLGGHPVNIPSAGE
ncbi:MAG: MMPL family transporter [Desulfofustis sp.]|nr:MMPL family transporter [Desulfofustis sp.]